MLARILLVLFGIGVGGSVAQGPEFIQQYMQRLGGRIDELSRFVQRLDEDASRSGMVREKALEEFTRYNNSFLESRGLDTRTMIVRFETYTAHKAALDQASPFERVTLFARSYVPEIASATLQDYRPAVPATAEGFLLGVVGFFVGYVFGEIVLRFGRWGLGKAFARA